MTVNLVFDKFTPNSNLPISNLIGEYYKNWNDAPYWFEWGGDVNKHLLTDQVWDVDTVYENQVIMCTLTSTSWDLHARCAVLKDVPYVVTVDIKLNTASNCNVFILDSDIWSLLGGQSFNADEHQLSTAEWTTVSIYMLPSKSGAVHLHLGALDHRLPVQTAGTVFIKNLRLSSTTTNDLVARFSCQNGSYTLLANPEQNTSCVLLSDIDNYQDDFNVYPIVITSAEYQWCWPLLLLSRKIVDLVNKNQLKILLLCSFEPVKDATFLSIHQQVAKICKLQRISRIENIIFAASDSTIERRLVEYKTEIFKSDATAQLIKFKDVNAYGYIVPKLIKYLDRINWLEVYCSNYDKEHLFLYLNNRITYHRYLLYKHLEYKNLLHHGMYSWNGWISNNTAFNNPASIFCSVAYNRSVGIEEQRFIDYVVSNLDIPTAKLPEDPIDLTQDPLAEGAKINPSWIANTYFSVVSETHVGELPSHVTEKIYKLIFCCHPFIIIGPKHHLATLHRYGFKTFPEMFDESYDSMPESFEKYNLVSDQIKFYTTDEGRMKLKQLFPILKTTLEYNRNHLLSLSSDDVWNSLEKLYEVD